MSSMIHCGDNIPFVQSLPQSSIHLTVTSPPYDGIRDYNGTWSIDLPCLGKELFDVTVDGGIAAVVIQDGTKDGAKTGTTARMICAWLDAGWRLWETLIWERPGQPGAWWNNRFRVDHEFVVVFLKGHRPRFFDKEPLKIPAIHAGKTVHGSNRLTSGELRPIKGCVVADTKCRGTVWKNAKSNTERNALKSKHPATFPDSIASDIITCFSRPGDTILDPFLGSGTVLVQALRLGRNAIGCDISQEYCQIARERMAVEVSP